MKINPNFPFYIPSKSRHKSRLTMKALDEMGLSYFVIIEDHQYTDYVSVIDKDKLLVLDKAYQRDYDTFDDLGDSKSKGPGPARNFAWDHSVADGHGWHWVMDDNISGFYRLNKNLKVPTNSPAIFRAMEDFVLRYKNVVMAGPNYFMFAKRKDKLPPFVCNTRIYSCNFIRNNVPFRWRGRYNEDTDLSLRMLKASWCTIQFNAFLQYKMPTQTVKGGNTEEFYHTEGNVVKGEHYAKGGTLAKSKMLVEMHPDVSTLVKKFGRWHHEVSYRAFRMNKLIRRDNIEIPTEPNEYGMKLVKVKPKRR